MFTPAMIDASRVAVQVGMQHGRANSRRALMTIQPLQVKIEPGTEAGVSYTTACDNNSGSSQLQASDQERSSTIIMDGEVLKKVYNQEGARVSGRKKKQTIPFSVRVRGLQSSDMHKRTKGY